MSENNVPAGWYQDPSGQGEARYWNGSAWTATVTKGGATSNAALDPSYAAVPPAPGTEVHLPSSANAAPAATKSKSSPVVAILGTVVALVAIIVLVIALSSDDSGDTSPDDPATTEAPSDTQAPPDTEAPADTEAPETTAAS